MKKSSLSFYLVLVHFFCSPASGFSENDSSFVYKKIRYEISLGYTLLTSNEWWSRIEPYNIYLGALPLKNKGHLEAIVSLGVTYVLSVVEDFEVEDSLWNRPIKPEDWEKEGISVGRVRAIDFCPLTIDEIAQGVVLLSRAMEEGRTIYVHCKAGRGRSASIVIAYLMQTQGLSFEEAYEFVKDRRKCVNLNALQRKSVADYFFAINDPVSAHDFEQSGDPKENPGITQESLSTLLTGMLEFVIHGYSGDVGENRIAKSISDRLPSIRINSTLSRRNRYLREFDGNQSLAVRMAIDRNHGWKRKLKIAAAHLVPYVGMPTGYSLTIWHQLREIALIAAIYGHNLEDREVQTRILSALLGGNAMKIPALTVDLIAGEIMRTIVLQSGLEFVPGLSLPTHMIFNYFTSGAAKVSTYAESAFGGENIVSIPEGEYRK